MILDKNHRKWEFTVIDKTSNTSGWFSKSDTTVVQKGLSIRD